VGSPLSPAFAGRHGCLAFVACRLLWRSRLGEVSRQTQEGPRLEAVGLHTIMTTTSTWAIRYLLVVLAALFAGPLLSKLSIIQALHLTLFGLSGQEIIRGIVEGGGLLALWVLALRTYRELPDNGRGYSFIRKLILPITALITLIAMNRILRLMGLSLIEHLGPRNYTLTYSAVLLSTGLWITVAWWLNLDALHCFFSSSEHETGRKPAEPTGEETDESNVDELNEPMESDDDALAAPKGPPATLGRYKVLRELGRGAMGVVYYGKDPTIHRFVAIKTMRLDDIEDWDKLQEAKTRFFREAESTGRLSHPNIVTIFDAGEENDLVYIAIELLQGKILKEWARKPNLMPWDTLLPILAMVADALDYAHQQGVVHRDIKPANIMLTDDHIVKVMDFGIAKMASSSRTTTETVLGTPTYMSPEQIAGKRVDGRSDIFSLGVVMFELLTGRPPFTGDNVSAVLFAIANTPPPAVATLRPDLPPAVQRILDCALQKDPVHRYRRAGEFARDLRACLEKRAA